MRIISIISCCTGYIKSYFNLILLICVMTYCRHSMIRWIYVHIIFILTLLFALTTRSKKKVNYWQAGQNWPNEAVNVSSKGQRLQTSFSRNTGRNGSTPEEEVTRQLPSSRNAPISHFGSRARPIITRTIEIESARPGNSDILIPSYLRARRDGE